MEPFNTMFPSSPDKLKPFRQAMAEITRHLTPHYPKAVLVFGSVARYLAGDEGDHLPNDLDLVVVCDNFPGSLESRDYGVPVQIHRYRTETMVAIARILRYDPKAVALAKLYGRLYLKQHAKDVIVAALMLGPGYNDFGIEQIEVGSLPDPRDYSVHTVLYGHAWWQRLRDYACERRGPLGRCSDKLIGNYEFVP